MYWIGIRAVPWLLLPSGLPSYLEAPWFSPVVSLPVLVLDTLFAAVAAFVAAADAAGVWQVLAMGASAAEALAVPVVGARLPLLFFEG